MRKIGAVIVSLLVAVQSLPSQAASESTALACQIDQTRTFTPPLGSVSGSSRYTFTATGSALCEGISNGIPAVLVGTISVGNKFSTRSALPACDALPSTERCADPETEYGPDGAQGCAAFADDCTEVAGGDGLLGCGRVDWWWQEPVGELAGTAAANDTTETRFIRWMDVPIRSGTTLMQLGNRDVGYLKLEGANSSAVVGAAKASMTGPGTSSTGCARQPASYAVRGTRDAGAQIAGALWAITPPSQPCSGNGCPWVQLDGADIVSTTH